MISWTILLFWFIKRNQCISVVYHIWYGNECAAHFTVSTDGHLWNVNQCCIWWMQLMMYISQYIFTTELVNVNNDENLRKPILSCHKFGNHTEIHSQPGYRHVIFIRTHLGTNCSRVIKVCTKGLIKNDHLACSLGRRVLCHNSNNKIFINWREFWLFPIYNIAIRNIFHNPWPHICHFGDGVHKHLPIQKSCQ